LAKGQTNEAISQTKRALEVDPFSLLFNNRLSSAYYYAREYDRALDQIKKTLEIDSQASFLYGDLCMVYAQKGMSEDALAACQKAIILQKDDPAALATLGVAYGLLGKRTEAEWVVNNLNQLAKKKYVPPYYVASIYAALDEKDQVFTWLNKARSERSFMMFIGIDPLFDKIRKDPRYNTLIEGMHLQQ
jgi:tetratricopeptide (TPR) repeat protein